MLPGLVYEYSVTLARPANGLKITPSVIGQSSITFEPAFGTYIDYTKDPLKFNLNCGTSTPAGDYYITWTKEEESGKDEYAEILSTILTVKVATEGTLSYGDVPSIDLVDFYYVSSGAKTVVNVKIS